MSKHEGGEHSKLKEPRIFDILNILTNDKETFRFEFLER